MRNPVAAGFVAVALAALLAATLPSAAQQPAQKQKFPRSRTLGRDLQLRRDPATGELRAEPVARSGSAPSPPAAIRAQVALVEVGCNVLSPDGAPLRGLRRDAFRVFEDGVEQAIAHFDASGAPASVALVVDASPSVFRELNEMKAAARTLAASLAPLDEVALVAFAEQAQLLLPFSRDRALLERAFGSRELARVANSAQSNIYQAVYLTARELFRGRAGRKAIVLLTDGQDSGLGLSWDPASAAPQRGALADRLTFEDVARELAAAGVELYAVSTQPRPRTMTDAWLDAHRNEMLVTPAARELGIPHYTLYLAELVRRAGGRLYFLGEMETLSEAYRRIVGTLGAQYTLGYYPSAGLARPGWRTLRVELREGAAAPAALRHARLSYRVTYYVPAGR